MSAGPAEGGCDVGCCRSGQAPPLWRWFAATSRAAADRRSPPTTLFHQTNNNKTVYKLTNNIDVIETEERVRDYQRRRVRGGGAVGVGRGKGRRHECFGLCLVASESW